MPIYGEIFKYAVVNPNNHKNNHDPYIRGEVLNMCFADL